MRYWPLNLSYLAKPSDVPINEKSLFLCFMNTVFWILWIHRIQISEANTWPMSNGSHAYILSNPFRVSCLRKLRSVLIQELLSIRGNFNGVFQSHGLNQHWFNALTPASFALFLETKLIHEQNFDKTKHEK